MKEPEKKPQPARELKFDPKAVHENLKRDLQRKTVRVKSHLP